MERVTVSLRIDPNLWKEARKYAIDKEISVAELVERAIKKEISTK